MHFIIFAITIMLFLGKNVIFQLYPGCPGYSYNQRQYFVRSIQIQTCCLIKISICHVIEKRYLYDMSKKYYQCYVEDHEIISLYLLRYDVPNVKVLHTLVVRKFPHNGRFKYHEISIYVRSKSTVVNFSSRKRVWA